MTIVALSQGGVVLAQFQGYNIQHILLHIVEYYTHGMAPKKKKKKKKQLSTAFSSEL